MIIGCTEFLCPQEGHIKRLLSSDWLPVKQALTPWDNCAVNIKRLLSCDWLPVKQALTPRDNCAGNIKRLLFCDRLPGRQALTPRDNCARWSRMAQYFESANRVRNVRDNSLLWQRELLWAVPITTLLHLYPFSP